MTEKTDTPISSMAGDELISYLHILSQRQAEYSNLRVKIIEELKPIERSRSDKRAELQAVIERQRQTKIEIAACKYAIKGEQS